MIKTERIIANLATVVSRTAFTACLVCFAPILTEIYYPDLQLYLMAAVYAAALLIQNLMLYFGLSAAIYWVVSVLLSVGAYFLCPAAGIIISSGILISAAAAPKEITRESFLGRIDITVVCIFIFSLLSNVNLRLMEKGNVQDATNGLLAALIMLLFAMVIHGFPNKSTSGNQRSGAFGKAAITAALAVFALGAAALIKVARGGMQSFASAIAALLKSIYMGFLNVLAFIATMVWKFFLWFDSLFDPVYDEIELPSEEAHMEFPPVSEEIQAVAPLWFKILLAGLAVFALGFALYRLSKKRMHLSFDPGSNVRIKRESKFLEYLKAAIAKLSDIAAYKVFCFTRKNTVPGLVCYVEKKARLLKKSGSRRPSESPQAYLRRLAAAKTPPPESTDAAYASQNNNGNASCINSSQNNNGNASCINSSQTLMELAALAELHFYSGRPQTPSKDLIIRVHRLVF